MGLYCQDELFVTRLWTDAMQLLLLLAQFKNEHTYFQNTTYGEILYDKDQTHLSYSITIL